MRIAALVLACALGAVLPAGAQTRVEPPLREGATPRNPAYLRASELLARREPAGSRVVRLEWEQVHASEYVLQGQWVEPGTWASHRRELTVTPGSSSRWDDRMVMVELPMEAGAHSWLVVAVFADKGPGDFARPTRVMFEVR
jgi:hypothetical protein